MAKRWTASYAASFKVDQSDRCYPKIVRVEQNSDGAMTFDAAKEALEDLIRWHRNHWSEQLRIAKATAATMIE